VTPPTTLVPGSLTVCTYGGFAPVCHRDAAGALVGLDVDFLARFADSLGLGFVAHERPFDGIWTLPGADACDIAGAGIMRRDDRPPGPGGAWSAPYFEVRRSLLVRAADQAAFDDRGTLAGRRIVVTRGSTADIDARTRYPRCTILFVDEVARGQPDAQEHIVRGLLARHEVDAFGEGDVSNRYLRDRYGPEVPGGLALADVHPIAGMAESFNFIVREASAGLLARLDGFIRENRRSYAPGA
jgi:ABC-type amino acid transport substrate-binding protein